MKWLLVFVLVLSACTPVHPWQRGRLAHPCMVADGRPEEDAARAHMVGARESTQGATGDRGGGCGCK